MDRLIFTVSLHLILLEPQSNDDVALVFLSKH